MNEHAEDIKSKNRFPSFFGRLSGPKTLNPKRDKKADNEDNASTVILKLKSPGAAGDKVEESNEQHLTDILTNEQLFDMLYGRSLVVQAEMTVEQRKDGGSPKTMTISGSVPVSLSRGERNGKPTRELRVRGHLRRKRSKEIRLPYDDLALKSSGFGTGERREIPWERKPKPPEESKLLQRSSKIHERYRTLSTVSTKSKRDSVWPQTDVEGVDSGDEDPEPSRIENWSPLFDFSSPMSGPTGRDRVRALSDWTTPTPRFDLDLMKDDSAEDRSKDRVQDAEKEKRLRYNQTSQNPKDDFKTLDSPLVINRTDSSEKEEYDKCTAKPCSNDKRNQTRDFGSQTSNSHKREEVNRVHSATQTDAYRHRESSPDLLIRVPKRTNLLSTEEIHEKLANGLKESKQMISSVHRKASNKFAEVHEKIQNAISKRAGEKRAGFQGSNHSPNHLDSYELVSPNHEADEQSNIRKYDCLYRTESKISHGSDSRVHSKDRRTVRDFAHNDPIDSPSREPGKKEGKYHPEKHVQTQEATRGKHEDNLQNLHYSTERGYYYEPPEDDPVRGKDKDMKSPEDNYDNFKTRLNMTRHGTAYPKAIEEARELIQRNSEKHDGAQHVPRLHGSKQSSPAGVQINGSIDSTNNGARRALRKDDIGSISSKSKSRTPTPNRKMLKELKMPDEKMQMNPITTITISRSHTRLYNYSDGYTYTEKAGRQMVVVEAPKGMYFAT